MERKVACRSVCALLLGVESGPLIAVAGNEPPPLSPPTTTAGAADVPPAPGPDPLRTIDDRPMLVIPGVNAPPRVHSRGGALPPLEPASPARPGEVPPLIGPSSSTASPTPGAAHLPLQPASPPAPTALPSTLEAIPGSGSNVEPPPARPAPRPAPPPLRRTPGILGRFLPPPFSPGRGGAEPTTITVEPSTDPAAEAALKRRIERQIRESLADRVREVEVRVVGRDVTIRARATRFWQRRAVRRTLETLPGLSGYRPRIEILE